MEEIIINKKINVKAQVKSTYEEYLDSLSLKQKAKFFKSVKDFALSELILALMEKDAISVRKLSKIAQLSPSVIQAMRSGTNKSFTIQSFFKILNGLGYKKLLVEHNGKFIPLNIASVIET